MTMKSIWKEPFNTKWKFSYTLHHHSFEQTIILNKIKTREPTEVYKLITGLISKYSSKINTYKQKF